MDTVSPDVVVGLSDRGERTILTEGRGQVSAASPFRIASLTKTFTSAATVLALTDRAIPLTTPAIELLPALAPDWRADRGITVEQLLAQVAGLREAVSGEDVAALGDSPGVLEETARLVVRAGNERTPGERWSYYNGNYFLVGSILAEVTGAGYELALKNTLLTPWGLDGTGFDTPAEPATGLDGQTRLPVEAYPRGRRPSGGLWSSVADYLTFAEHLLADPALLAETSRPRTRPGDPMTYGLGWAVGPSGQLFLNGRLPGYRAATLVIPEHGHASVAVGNQSQLLPELARRLSDLQRPLTGDDLSAEIDAFAA